MAIKNLIPYSRQWIDGKDIAEVVKVLKSDWITQGAKIAEFEKALARYVGTKYAVAVSSGTAALHAACAAANISSGDEVIIPTLSFVATANCVVHCGGKPVLVDVYPDTFTINAEEAEKKITKRTKAIIAVDLAGHPAEWRKLKKLAKKYKLLLIDDGAHSLGSKYYGKPIGSIADLTTFSFHPVKTITTGEGGAITTNNKNLYESLLALRHHGISKNSKNSLKIGGWFYDVISLGHNFRLSDIQAALGVSQLRKIHKFIEKRRKIWQTYSKLLGGVRGIELPIEKRGCLCAWHLYQIRINQKILGKSRRAIFEQLKSGGIGVQVHYIPIHLFTLYKKKFGYKMGDFPVAEKFYKQTLSLPLFPALKNKEHFKIIKSLKKILS